MQALGQDELPCSVAASSASSASCSRRGGDRSCRYVEERTSTKLCVVLSAGKGKGKPRQAASQAGRGTFLNAVFFLMLMLNNKAVSRRA